MGTGRPREPPYHTGPTLAREDHHHTALPPWGASLSSRASEAVCAQPRGCLDVGANTPSPHPEAAWGPPAWTQNSRFTEWPCVAGCAPSNPTPGMRCPLPVTSQPARS